MVKLHPFMIYQKSGKSVVQVGSYVHAVDELTVNVPTYAKYNIEGVAQFVMAGEGRVKCHRTTIGDNTVVSCVIDGE